MHVVQQFSEWSSCLFRGSLALPTLLRARFFYYLAALYSERRKIKTEQVKSIIRYEGSYHVYIKRSD